MTSILLIHAASTLYMTGLIWFVQLAHYPLIAQVGPTELPGWQAENLRRTTWAVGPAMLVELGCTLVLLVAPPAVPPALAWLGALLLAAIWTSTGFLQVPLHRAILDGPHGAAVRRLVTSNWVRTGLWSARAVVALALVAAQMAPA